MTLNRFVFKTHKWLAVGVGLFTLLWFASGVVMMLPMGFLGSPTAGPAGKFPTPDYKSIAITVPQAIAAAEASAGANMVTTGVSLRAIEGRLYYQISTAKSATLLIDAMSGERLQITEEYARQMALRLVGGRGPLQSSEKVRDNNAEYVYGPVPAFRFVFADPAATIVYISAESGEMLSSDRRMRIRGYITGTHTFDFFRGLMPQRGVKLLLIFFSFVGLVMSIFGTWILWIQYKNWLARRAGRPETV